MSVAEEVFIDLSVCRRAQLGCQVGVVEGMIGWRANWGAWSPQVGYRGRWLYDADGRFGQVAHGLIGGVTIGWPGQSGLETP